MAQRLVCFYDGYFIYKIRLSYVDDNEMVLGNKKIKKKKGEEGEYYE